MIDTPKLVELRPRADAETVDLIRTMLAKAEAGEIVSVLAICECPDGSREAVISACRDSFAVLADIHRLAHRHQIRMDKAVTT